jgi:predicted nucleic acid-binding protein
MPMPLAPDLALELVEDWVQQPPSLTVAPSQQHRSIFKEIFMPRGTAANLTSDAHLAALAIEHGARLYSTDNDSSRFKSLRWTNPIE